MNPHRLRSIIPLNAKNVLRGRRGVDEGWLGRDGYWRSTQGQPYKAPAIKGLDLSDVADVHLFRAFSVSDAEEFIELIRHADRRVCMFPFGNSVAVVTPKEYGWVCPDHQYVQPWYGAIPEECFTGVHGPTFREHFYRGIKEHVIMRPGVRAKPLRSAVTTEYDGTEPQNVDPEPVFRAMLPLFRPYDTAEQRQGYIAGAAEEVSRIGMTRETARGVRSMLLARSIPDVGLIFQDPARSDCGIAEAFVRWIMQR